MTDESGSFQINCNVIRSLSGVSLRTTKTALYELETLDLFRYFQTGFQEGRLSYRSGYYARSLITRVGKLELRVPQDRNGRFSTEIFERYQRSEKTLGLGLEPRPADRLFKPRAA